MSQKVIERLEPLLAALDEDFLESPHVAALVPAYNEEEIIERTINSLMAQTYALRVLVVANNCKDGTENIVRSLQNVYGEEKLQLEVMPENKYKKSGALNYGFSLLDERTEYVFGMDADTVVHEKIIEEGVKQFEREPKTAGICSAYRTLPLKRGASTWQRFLWRLQNIEFGLANAWRVENYKSARVLPGVSVMFRVEALREVAVLQYLIEQMTVEHRSHKRTLKKTVRRHIRKEAIAKVIELRSNPEAFRRYVAEASSSPLVWAIDSLVEDYRLTLDLKDLGWEVKSSLDMISWSDVPLKTWGKGGVWDQRQRWYSGTIDEIRLRGLQKHSRYELFTIVLLVTDLLMRLTLYGSYGLLLLSGASVQWLTPFLLLPLSAIIIQTRRLLRYADQLDGWQIFMTVTLVANELYAMYRAAIYAYSIWLSYCRPNRPW